MLGGILLKSILVLEDNPAALEHLSAIIKVLDMRNDVYSFMNLKDAYQCAMERAIDLFLIDIILDTSHPGDVSGLKFAENIREVEAYRFTPIIFITSLEDPKLYTYEKLHCYHFIEKPFKEEQVKQSVEQCLKFPSGGRKTKHYSSERKELCLQWSGRISHMRRAVSTSCASIPDRGMY